MLLRAGALDGPARAVWEQRQIDAERRTTAIAEQLARIQDRYEYVAFMKWFAKRLAETPRVIPD